MKEIVLTINQRSSNIINNRSNIILSEFKVEVTTNRYL